MGQAFLLLPVARCKCQGCYFMPDFPARGDRLSRMNFLSYVFCREGDLGTTPDSM